MRYLLDTGILVRLPHRTDPQHQIIRDALRKLVIDGHSLATARQNVIEFWNVCTRPISSRGGFELSAAQTLKRLRLIERRVEVLNEPDSVYQNWKSIVARYSVAGRQVHDAKIAAVMMSHRIKHIITLNVADFSRYREVTALLPAEIFV